jgi:hypothetical protein
MVGVKNMADVNLLAPPEPEIEPILAQVKEQFDKEPKCAKGSFVASLSNWLERNSWPTS